MTLISDGSRMHRLACLARVAGVGGVVTAASLISIRQERARDREETSQRDRDREEIGQRARDREEISHHKLRDQPLHSGLVTNLIASLGDHMSGDGPLHRGLVTNVSNPWGDHTSGDEPLHSNLVTNDVSDNVSEEQGDEAGEVDEELEEMAETVTKPNELSKQQAQAEKLKAAINKVVFEKIVTQHHSTFVSCKGPESGVVQDV